MALTDWIVGKWGFNGNVQWLSGNWYNWTVSWNVTFSSDAVWPYMYCNWAAVNSVGTPAVATIGNVMNFTEATDFSISRMGYNSALPSWQACWIFGSGTQCVFHRNSNWTIRWWIRNWWSSSLYDIPYAAVPLDTNTHLVLSYVASSQLFYIYLNWALQNSWGTASPATFTTTTWRIWDTALLSWNTTSCPTYHYSAIVWNRTLSAKEVAQLANTQLGKMEIAKNAVFYNLNEQ